MLGIKATLFAFNYKRPKAALKPLEFVIEERYMASAKHIVWGNVRCAGR